MSDTGVTVKKNEDFSEWYTQVILKSSLADYAPVKGCMIFREDSYAIWEKIQEIFNQKIKATGHRNVYFPLFIPESFLKRESEHFAGFVPEVAWVTQGGDTPLEEKLAIRPTSETIMYATYAKWIRSWRDLPLKLNQWNTVVRWETKATKLFLRTREFLWQEGHTAHATEKEADQEAMEILNAYKDVMESYLAVPVLAGKKTEMEKFAGALYTLALEAMMPDGKALQMGTSHQLGQNFSKVFNIKFLDQNEKEQNVWQTSWGFSTRMIGALVMLHGDDKGLVLPPRVAPTQVVIVPIPYRGIEAEEIAKKAEEVRERLRKTSIAVILDDRKEYTPGWKFNEWEMKGVPIRIEIGPRDIKQQQVIMVRRDTSEKTAVKDKLIETAVSNLLEEIQSSLLNKARKALQDSTATVKTYSEFKETLESKGGFIRASWCSDQKCEEKIKEETGATIRIVPFEKEEPFSKCIYCERQANEVVYFARSY
ncbi:MAG: proline--tRNA ligase [Candidatus Bathyarchaeia archaeon]|jgi:prolyl-tRNA synthetase